MYKKKQDKINHLFRGAFLETSEFLKTKLRFQNEASLYNMDAGIPLEEYFRQEFGQFIPEYFAVDAGTIIDSESYTCGDCDFVIYDKRYMPFIKFPATKFSRHKYIAFETTYGVIEVKKRLTLGATQNGSLKEKPSGSLYEACTKLFAYKELSREIVDATRVITGVKIGNLQSDESQFNKPLTLAFFYDIDSKIDINDSEALDELAEEFAVINASVSPELRVNGIFILDKVSFIWLNHLDSTNSEYKYIYHPIEINPTRLAGIKSGEDTLYFMFVYLLDLLIATHLNPPNFKIKYGGYEYLSFSGKLVPYEF